jgi:hypothetical protein
VWDTTLFVAKAATPCKPFCKTPLPQNCSKDLVRGLAFNVCRQELYAAHGPVTTVIYVADPTNCKFLFRRCCKKGNAGDWHGLAFVPGWTLRQVSKGCTAPPCPSCPTMMAGPYGGDSSLGNTAFGIKIENAPTGSFGFLLLKAGPCGPGINLPFLCGPLHPLPPDLVFAATLTGMGTCGGSAEIPLPLPPNPALCKSAICAQWVVLCTGGAGIGYGLSNAFFFSIASS